MSNELYVAWQDEATRTWHTIARLKRLDHGYELALTKGAERLDEVTRQLFRLKPGERYFFDDLIPFFKNKIPPRSRPDFVRMADWLGVSDVKDDFALLTAFGILASSDSTLVYPVPTIEHGLYNIKFFVHGIRHRQPSAILTSELVEPGVRLLPMLDVQNPFDANAVALKVENTDTIVGYVPAFYAADFKSLLSDPQLASRASITVVRNNNNSPIQLRLFCEFNCPTPDGFVVLSSEAHTLALRKTQANLSLSVANTLPTDG